MSQAHARSQAGLGHDPGTGSRPPAFAATFGMETTALQARDQNASWRNAYDDTGRMLAQHGSTRQQGGACFGHETVDAVRCALTVQDLSRNSARLCLAARGIRMFRIEGNNDLTPATASARP